MQDALNCTYTTELLKHCRYEDVCLVLHSCEGPTTLKALSSRQAVCDKVCVGYVTLKPLRTPRVIHIACQRLNIWGNSVCGQGGLHTPTVRYPP